MVYRFTARAMLAGYRDIEALYTPEGVLENQPAPLDWFLVHQAGFPKLGAQEVLWVLSCGRFRIHWNLLSDSDTELWVSSILQPCDHLCINTPAYLACLFPVAACDVSAGIRQLADWAAALI